MKRKHPVEFKKMFLTNVIPTMMVCQREAGDDQSWMEEGHVQSDLIVGNSQRISKLFTF